MKILATRAPLLIKILATNIAKQMRSPDENIALGSKYRQEYMRLMKILANRYLAHQNEMLAQNIFINLFAELDNSKKTNFRFFYRPQPPLPPNQPISGNPIQTQN